jgi:hypothetical protein
VSAAVVSRYFWRTTEDRLVQREYPLGGAKQVARHLPHRSLGSIYERAALLGLRRPGRRGRASTHGEQANG